jgi:hypothetical protein
MQRGGSGGLPQMALAVVAVAAGGVYALHMAEIPPPIGVAIGVSIAASALLLTDRVSASASIVVSAIIVMLGLAVAVALAQDASRAGRILRNLAWAQALLSAWVTYTTAATHVTPKSAIATFDDVARARWRSGDLAFGAELARRIVVRAQPSWAALVVETAWPEPRPEAVVELLNVAATASAEDVRAILERIREKGGTEAADARWALARTACEVVLEARGRTDEDDVGGQAVARLVVAAAKVVRDDDAAVRIFSALVLPAIARRA